MTHDIEIEIKVQVPQTAIERLHDLPEIQLKTPRTLEQNFLFDTPQRAFSRKKQLLRYRIFGKKAWLTWKGPVSEEDDVRYKIRKEISIEVAPSTNVIEFMQHIGLNVWFMYEKYRTIYQTGDLVICIDETPIGKFIELEGPKHEIETWIQKMDWEHYPRTTENYYTLFCKARDQGKVKGPHMLFHEGELELQESQN